MIRAYFTSALEWCYHFAMILLEWHATYSDIMLLRRSVGYTLVTQSESESLSSLLPPRARPPACAGLTFLILSSAIPGSAAARCRRDWSQGKREREKAPEGESVRCVGFRVGRSERL